ncbi:MAG: hypothetical protein AB2A00_12640 [Myxococcota bacterium]
MLADAVDVTDAELDEAAVELEDAAALELDAVALLTAALDDDEELLAACDVELEASVWAGPASSPSDPVAVRQPENTNATQIPHNPPIRSRRMVSSIWQNAAAAA